MSSAMKELLTKVEAGTFKFNGWADYPIDRKNMGRLDDAYLGSLDAALALHDAVLPGWGYSVSDDGDEFHAMVAMMPENRPIYEDWHEVAARAWLISILKALTAQEATK